MKRLFSILLCLLFFFVLCGTSRARMLQGVAGGVTTVSSYLIEENFDGATACGDGVHSNCNNTWTQVGTNIADFNYATSPAPLSGSYSALFSTIGSTAGYTLAFTEQDTVHFFMEMNPVTRSSGSQYIELLASDDTVLLRVTNVAFEFAMYCGPTVWGYSTAPDQGTTYYIWGDYTKGNGTNSAVCHLYHSTDTTKGAADITITNGDAASKKAGKVFFGERGTDGGNTMYDKIRVSTSSIGDNPQ
jgi:hypothetical protein